MQPTTHLGLFDVWIQSIGFGVHEPPGGVSVEYLVVAGGSMVGRYGGGGGAGDGAFNGFWYCIWGGVTYTVTVGAGGAGQAFTGNNNSRIPNQGQIQVWLRSFRSHQLAVAVAVLT